jgi:tetratricopeptide (TPR) repeat protein
MADMQQLPSISSIDLRMADEKQPWSPYALRHQTGGNVERVLPEFELLLKQLEDAGLAEHKNKFEEGQASEYLSNRQDSPPELRCISDRFLAESHSTIVNEQWEETVEESSLECVSDLAVKLASSHIEHDESAPQTLKKEFELAEALERMGQYEKAEYHCRRILDIHSQIVVEAFLGKILAKTHRFEEATFLLFHALAAFIILFIQNSLDENARLFARIEAVMIELLLQSDEGPPSLTDHWGLMRDTLQKPTSDGEIYQICPQLFLHGFSFAHECLALGLVDSNQYLLESAGCLYRDLLGHSFHQLDVHHAIEKATAHRGYARLLRKEKKWISSANQWLLACESALNSAIHDRDLIELLESDYHKLLLHLSREPHEEGSLKDRMKQALARIRGPSPFAMEHISEPVQGSHVEEYLLSSDLPLHMIAVEPSVISHVARFGLSLGLSSSAHGDKDRTSTASMTASSSRVSHPWGKTMSAGENRGLGMVF